jgi:hypothetical protein
MEFNGSVSVPIYVLPRDTRGRTQVGVERLERLERFELCQRLLDKHFSLLGN